MCREDQREQSRARLRTAVRSFAPGVLLAALCAPIAYADDKPAVCAECHDTAVTLAKSVHGEAGAECVSCHTDLAETKEFPHAKPAPVACTSCHDVKVSESHPPACADCHGRHEITRVDHTTRSAAAARLSSTCGACHEQTAKDYMEGIHGRELAKGNPDVPTCLTCHGGHAIMMNEDPNSPVNPSSLAHTCASCHDNDEIAGKYGMPPERLETFVGSFHGLANEYGQKGVANCASCHGEHKILPSSDPASSIHANNLPSTCGKCHEQAGKHFASGKIHLRDRWEDNPFTYVAGVFYRTMISGMMAVFGIFMIVDFRYRMKRRIEEGACGPKARRPKAGGSQNAGEDEVSS